MRWQPPTIAVLIGCLTTAAFNSLGWLQISERQLYDYYLRSRPEEPQDKKIIIIGLTEKDIEKLGFPISDDTLATLLTKIKEQNPRAIGLDLHRNVNIGEEGNKKLDNIFSSTPQLIGVEKTDERIEGIIKDIRDKWLDKREVAYWCQDETRVGLRTELGKKITLKGVKPQQTLQWHYEYYYIYGLIEPVGGGSFFYEFSHFNSDCMSIFLEKFKQENQEKIHIIQLDNASIHTAKKLEVPENIILWGCAKYYHSKVL